MPLLRSEVLQHPQVLEHQVGHLSRIDRQERKVKRSAAIKRPSLPHLLSTYVWI